MLTQDEEEIYDRQIRLWGLSAQNKIRQSKVLMLGFNGVASEVAKILVLAGIDSLTIVDDKPSPDPYSNLFLRNADEHTDKIKQRLKTLNPSVKINIRDTSIVDLESSDFDHYDLVTLHKIIHTAKINSMNHICRSKKSKFYVVVDFGFFGFMFNDLGPEFKFTHEEFTKIDANEDSPKAEPQDAANSVDRSNNDTERDVGYESSDGEDDRPKKKMRVHSPGQNRNGKKSSDKRTVVGTLSYVTFGEMISLKNTNFSKQTSPVLFMAVALYRFYNELGRLPNLEGENNHDLSKLEEMLQSLRNSTSLNSSVFARLQTNWTSLIEGSLSPVCAVLGGIAGQDMIRAISHKDIPIHNTFTFDGVAMNGIVEKLGLLQTSSSNAQPVVRDLVEIDVDSDVE